LINSGKKILQKNTESAAPVVSSEVNVFYNGQKIISGKCGKKISGKKRSDERLVSHPIQI